MELLFFGGRRRYPGETVAWGQYLSEWMEHPLLFVAMIFCVIWMFIRIYTFWRYQKKEREKQERQKEFYGDTVEAKAEKEYQNPEGIHPKQ